MFLPTDPIFFCMLAEIPQFYKPYTYFNHILATQGLESLTEFEKQTCVKF